MQDAAQLGYKFYIFSRRFRIMIVSAVLSFTLVMCGYGLISARYSILDLAVNAMNPKYNIELCFYNGLTRREQILYEKLDASVASFKEHTVIMPYVFSQKELENCIQALQCDKPEYFYVDFSDIILTKSRRRMRATIKYIAPQDEIALMTQKLNSTIQSAVKQAESAENEIGRELVLHDYLIDSCRYNEDADGVGSSAYGALINGEASSMGYALAMKMLLNSSGISAIAVAGTAAGADHIWNMVYADGYYYHLDSAWNDVDEDFASELRFHGYFNLSDAQIFADHIPDDIDIISVAVNDCSYYKYMDLYADNLNAFKVIIDREINGAVVGNRTYIELYPDFDIDEYDVYSLIISSIDAVNAYVKANNVNVGILKSVARVYQCSYTNPSLTIQLFYE